MTGRTETLFKPSQVGDLKIVKGSSNLLKMSLTIDFYQDITGLSSGIQNTKKFYANI